MVQHVPVPFVDTPLTSNVREAVERDWSTNLNGPAVRLYEGEESAAFRVGDVGSAPRARPSSVGVLRARRSTISVALALAADRDFAVVSRRRRDSSQRIRQYPPDSPGG